MKKISSKQLRSLWLDFYKKHGHVDVGSVSLISDGATGVLFNVAGMQPLMPYLLGKKHEKGTRLCNIQGCVRTNDIDSVGDSSHVTFFEMMGSWSLGDYFKKERIDWSYELLTEYLGFSKDRIAATVFAGEGSIPRDSESAVLREQSGISKENIYFLSKEHNWWELDRGPCGPDSEMYYITDKPKCCETCNPGCDCGKFIEIGNDVFMQYNKIDDTHYELLENKNVDTGWGFERILAFINSNGDVYKTDVFENAIKILEQASNKKYLEDESTTRSLRIIADHIRTSTMLLGDVNHLVPSNVGSGYILRRLIRRAVRHAKLLNINTSVLLDISMDFIDNVYGDFYKELLKSKEFVQLELKKEINKFENSLVRGLKEFDKLISSLKEKDMVVISGTDAFRLYDTFGFPLELTQELAVEHNFEVDKKGFEEAFKLHQEKSKIQKGVFASGLESNSDKIVKYHTATHLLNSALKIVIGANSHQKGSNITEERMRFDFASDHKLSDEELNKVSEIVNDWIDKKIDVTFESMPKLKAVEIGAEHQFIERYPDVVSVYSIGNVSKEICSGPHVKNTKELGKFVIQKEEACSTGVRRIRAVLED